MAENFDVVIIGAGHIGLSASYFLKKSGISHVVLEKDSVASTWTTQRWDSFNLVLPNWSLKFPDFPYQGHHPDGFLNLAETIQYIKDFSVLFELPVQTGIEVLELTRDSNLFLMKTNRGFIKARSVILATGSFNQPKIPDFAKQIPKEIQQMHSSQYRNPSQIKSSSVLVVGTGQSGTQIADELHESGFQAYLSVSRCGGRPRRYRGKDCSWWMNHNGFYDQKPETIPSVKSKTGCNVPLTGQNGGLDVNLNDFSKKGIQLLGKITKVEQNQLFIADDLTANLTFADQEWHRFLIECDQYAELKQLPLPLESSAYHFTRHTAGPERLQLDLIQENIGQIIWATGFQPSYHWVSLPIFNSDGSPLHQNGIAGEKGLFFVGLPWQSKRSSTLFLGSTDDAYLISEQVKQYLILS